MRPIPITTTKTIAAEPSHAAPDGEECRPSIVGKIVRSSYIWLPCAYVLLLVGGVVALDMPNNFDRLDESYEPLKTFKFVYSRGRTYHHWGPFPNFVYAPVYAAPMAYWYLTGDLGKASTDYPYGFTRPFEQQGLLIVLARLVGLALGTASMAIYGRALYRFTGSAVAAFLVVMLLIATSPELAFKFVATKPDGLMLAFLVASIAVYTDIVGSGLTWRRGALLSLFAVFSISCKELTAPVYILPYAGLAVTGWFNSAGDSARRHRFLVDFVITVATGLVAYGLINIVYAPATWLERMNHWLFGVGKDPNIWAPSGYTLSAYVRDIIQGLLFNLGPGGVAIVAAAGAISLIAPVRHRGVLWLPSLSLFTVVALTAGYMPNYFVSPLNVTLALPVAASLAYAWQHWIAGSPRAIRTAVAVPIVLLCLANAWHSNRAWTRAYFSAVRLEERYCFEHVGKAALIHTGNMHGRQSGADRLSYLGFNVDDRPLGALLDRPERMPDVIMITTEQLAWINDFKGRPARNRMMESTGYSYNRFAGFESLGYRLVDTLRPDLTWQVDIPWLRQSQAEVLVYRRVASPRSRRAASGSFPIREPSTCSG